MKKYRPIFLVVCTVVILAFVGYLLVRNAHFDVLQPTGTIAKQQKNLLIGALGLSALVVIPVFFMLGLFAWKYRAGAQARYTPEWSSNRKLETIWWGIPIAIIAVLAVITWQTSHSLDPYKPIASSTKQLEVQVIALQWKWLFIYPELGIATMNHLPIPVDTPVHFRLAADAPMSAFWVPSLGSQIYAMSAMSSQLHLQAEETGEFTGYSTNINGRGYSDMKFRVEVQSKADFEKWTKRAVASKSMMDRIAYEKVAKPGTMGEETYMLMDSELYRQVLEKYGGHMMHDNQPFVNSGETNTTHEHHHMEES